MVSTSPRYARLIELSRDGSSSRIVRTAASRLALSLVRQAPGQQLVQDHAQRVHVAARVELQRIGQDLFGAHVGQRADQLAELGLPRRVGVAVGETRDAEVEDLRLTRLVDQDVARLEVAMDDAALVGVLHGVADLRHQLEPLRASSTQAPARSPGASRRG